ncbi:hypothetical protein [Mammaliicoccus lentus]|uniref:hypothetical protein n=1 Tax=Mammaliicoccus lentus TaxID=42858 RepID=UPI00374E5DE1
MGRVISAIFTILMLVTLFKILGIDTQIIFTAIEYFKESAIELFYNLRSVVS